jgi:myo-inositol-1(or 4)-monophosphatase
LESGSPEIQTKINFMQALDSIHEICEAVCDISRRVGAFILVEQKKLTEYDVESKGLNDFVTYVDKAAEERLVAELNTLIPDAGFITEEATIAREDKEFIWIIDPIDGTTNFIHGLPLFSISIALMHKDKIILGVVYEISRDECFHAIEGGNAYLNNEVIHVTSRNLLKESLLVTGFPYKDVDRLDQWMKLFVDLLKRSHGVRRLGSAAIDLAYVACGRFEAFYEFGLSPWDVAAGAFIVQQAGGRVSDYSGGSNFIFGKELLAGNGQMNEELREVIREHIPEK